MPFVVAGRASVGHIGEPESNADRTRRARKQRLMQIALGALESSA
jgi:hypothetical protein